MASTAQAYDNPERAPSGNLSPYQLKKLVRYSGIPAPQKELFLAALEISKGAGVLMWASVKSLAIETKRSERTIYHRLRRARLPLKLLDPARDPGTWDSCPKCGAVRQSKDCACGYEGSHNEFRRSRTFRLNVMKISQWPLNKGIRAGSYHEYKNSPDYAGRKNATPAAHRSPQRSQVQKPAPVPITRPHTLGGSRAERETRKLRQDLGKRMAELMKGRTKVVYAHNMGGYPLTPASPEWIAPMSQDAAIRATAAEFGMTPDEISEHLRLMHWKFATEETLE